MKMFVKIRNLAFIALLLSMMQTIAVSCSDDPGAENYYTFTGEMAKDYLSERDQFSEFVTILDRSKMLDLLGTYGEYTVFAPTNDAIELYLSGLGLESVNQLSKEDCDTIAFTHIIKQAFYTTDYTEGESLTNMLDRPISVTYLADSVSVPGEIRLSYFLNNASKLDLIDDSVKNGVIHTIDKVLVSSTDMLPDMIAKDANATLFYEALRATGLDLLMMDWKDDSYATPSVDSIATGLAIKTASEFDIVYYSKNREIKYTAFVEPDSVFHAHGVKSLDDMKRLAAEIYDDMYPEDAEITDMTDRRNSLNRFISYHLLDRLAEYDGMAVENNELFKNNFKHRLWDVADWYETMMPHSIMKISHPTTGDKGTGDLGIFVNRRGVGKNSDGKVALVPGARVYSSTEAGGDHNARNGTYHYISDIISYGRETQEVVLNERIRIDATTLSPDFMTSGARGHYARSGPFNNRYALWSDSKDPNVNGTHAIGFKTGYVKNFTFQNPETHIHVRNRFLDFWSYQGDELTISGNYDFTFKLPPLPEGTYEFRIATCVDFAGRGIIQIYFQYGDDGALQPCGIPFDMRVSGPNIGWRSDDALGDEDAISAFDKTFHNIGWMKGPDSYCHSDANTAARKEPFRSLSNTLRKVVTQFHTDGKTNCYIRVQQKLEKDDAEFAFDYIELVPSSVYNNEAYPEDKH
ncbi:MAG: fasciclin domain-containing protein [Bacteroides sp.]|nr:fasciclin domain-containing protein [Roseburia sp.]MCM1346535.1 fasciclin domain-containing protein [Bacteroides sp.]MCM1421102.1 fasciclin domain-containing protein [Bacteroides sp.]